jgi:hypothetical protein
MKRGGHSSAGRAPALHAGGRQFDPDWLHIRVLITVDKREDLLSKVGSVFGDVT